MGSDTNTPPTGGPQLVIMAAGMGSPYRGLNQFDPIGPAGEVILEYSVHDALRTGFDKVVILLRRAFMADFRERIGRRIEKRIDVAYVVQDLDELPPGFTTPLGRNKPWGTAHAVLCAEREITAPFAVINADDYYGPGALRTVADYLRGDTRADDGVPEYCLAGYHLVNTLSQHGHVSRGICQVDPEGFLANIVERTCIPSYPSGVRFLERGGEWGPISGDSTTSMNLWGFTRDIFPDLDRSFRAFLETGIWALDNECLLPTVVGLLLSEQRARIRVLPTDEQWHGVTYREDKPELIAAIARRVERGDYPSPLWD